jgi:hypothetical protein
MQLASPGVEFRCWKSSSCQVTACESQLMTSWCRQTHARHHASPLTSLSTLAKRTFRWTCPNCPLRASIFWLNGPRLRHIPSISPLCWPCPKSVQRCYPVSGVSLDPRDRDYSLWQLQRRNRGFKFRAAQDSSVRVCVLPLRSEILTTTAEAYILQL